VVVQECAAGLVQVRRGLGGLAFAAPPLLRGGPLDDVTLDRVAAALRLRRDEILDATWADNGPGWIAVRLVDAAAVLGVRPGALGGLDLGVVGPRPQGDADAVEVRAFFEVAGAVREDPVTGSLQAALAPWLVGAGITSYPYTARQGTAVARQGRVGLDLDAAGTVWVAGSTVTVVAGTVRLP
jgi:predicted PhzF superfamily epimerase YddE/YHI9